MEDKQRLRQILGGMDIPRERYDDLGWLCRNLAFNNREHRDYHEAKHILHRLMWARSK